MTGIDTTLRRGYGTLPKAGKHYEGRIQYCGISHACTVRLVSAGDAPPEVLVEIFDAPHDEMPPEALRPAFEDVPAPVAPTVALSPRRELPKKLVDDPMPF